MRAVKAFFPAVIGASVKKIGSPTGGTVGLQNPPVVMVVDDDPLIRAVRQLGRIGSGVVARRER